ncbi:MAG: DUF1444 family protein [Anaerolineae bacterium]|nr:DUF1444 family protein [Anaerolineae bacterium]
MADRLLTERDLAARLADRLRREPGVINVRIGAQGGLEVQMAGQDKAYGIGLGNLHRMYIMAPAQVDQLVEMMVQQVRSLPAQLQAKERGSPTQDLFPQIKAAEFLRQADKQKIRIARQPLVGDLSIVYVADTPTSMRFLTDEDIAKNKLTLAQLHELTLANLARKIANTGYMVAGEGARTLLISQSRDSYDAARILLPDLRTQAVQYLGGGRLLFGIPNRDFLIMLSDQDTEFVAEIAAQVARDYESQPHPLSPRLYTIVDGKFTEYR